MIIVYTFERGGGPRAPPSPQAGVTAGNCQPLLVALRNKNARKGIPGNR
jgi:hypothetical protein